MIFHSKLKSDWQWNFAVIQILAIIFLLSFAQSIQMSWDVHNLPGITELHLGLDYFSQDNNYI